MFLDLHFISLYGQSNFRQYKVYGCVGLRLKKLTSGSELRAFMDFTPYLLIERGS